jgi:transposase-like protein
MTERELDRRAAHRLAIIHHAQELTGNVAKTCRYYAISRQVYYKWLRRSEAEGLWDPPGWKHPIYCAEGQAAAGHGRFDEGSTILLRSRIDGRHAFLPRDVALDEDRQPIVRVAAK